MTAKIYRDKTKAIVVIPSWPTQHWYSSLLSDKKHDYNTISKKFGIVPGFTKSSPATSKASPTSKWRKWYKFIMAHGNGNTCISEERLTVLMKKIFAEELEKQQQGLLKLISGNFEITMKEIKNVKSEMNELKKSIEFTEEVLEEKVQTMHRKVSSLEEKVEEICDYQIDPDEVQKKLTDLEDRCRRNNLRIDGVEEENGESWDDCERKVKEIFMNKLELENDIIIERAHRAGKANMARRINLEQ